MDPCSARPLGGPHFYRDRDDLRALRAVVFLPEALRVFAPERAAERFFETVEDRFVPPARERFAVAVFDPLDAVRERLAGDVFFEAALLAAFLVAGRLVVLPLRCFTPPLRPGVRLFETPPIFAVPRLTNLLKLLCAPPAVCS